MTFRLKFSISIVTSLFIILGLVFLISFMGSEDVAYASSDIIESFSNTTWVYNGKLASENYSINLADGYSKDIDILSISYYDESMNPVPEPKDAGEYVVEVQTSDYQYTTQQLIINKVMANIDFKDKSCYYGDSVNLDISDFDIYGLIEGEDKSVLTSEGTISCDYSLYDPVGEYFVEISGCSANNYEFIVTGGILTINPRPITVTIQNKSSNYGNELEELTAQVTIGSIVNNDNVYTLSCNVTSTSPVDLYDIEGTRINTNYNVTFRNGTGTKHTGDYNITQRYITVTIDNKSSQYGEEPEELTAQVTSGSILGTDSPYTLSCSVTANTGVGAYNIIGQETGDDNYVITFENQEESYTVLRREVAVTAEDKHGYYGDNQVQLTYIVTSGSIYNNEDIIDFEQSVSHSTLPGTYQIVLKLKDNAYMDNYNVAFTNGTYTVLQRPINIILNNKTSQYGDDLLALDAMADPNTPLVNGDSISSLITMEIIGMTEQVVGEYVITGSDNSVRYDITVIDGKYNITPRIITVTIYDHTITYGDDLEELTSDYDGILPDDEDKGVYSLNCEAISSPNAGVYTITASSNYQNYAVSANVGTYTINPKAATVTISNKHSIYGEDIAILSSTSTGILNADKPLAYKVSCDITSSSDVGEYEIVGTALTQNYDIEFTNGIYRIFPKDLTVTIDDKTSEYGEALVTLTATDDGILEEDIGYVYTLSCEAVQGSPVGNYVITGTAITNNYDITFVDGEYIVTKKQITLTWSNLSFIYDGTEKLPQVSIDGIFLSDNLNVTINGAQTNAGTYTATVEIDDNPNYILPDNAEQEFVIDKAAPKFDFTDMVNTFEYDGKEHSVYGITGTGAISYKNNLFREIGKYTIIVRCAASANYYSGETSITAEITNPKNEEEVIDNESNKTNIKSEAQLLEEKATKSNKMAGIAIWAIAGAVLLAMALAIIVFEIKRKNK